MSALHSSSSDSSDDSCRLSALLHSTKKDDSFDKFTFVDCCASLEDQHNATFEPPPLEQDCAGAQSSRTFSTPQKRTREDSSGEETLIASKRKRSSDWRSKDISVHERKSAWSDAYGDARVAKCFICQFNEVGWENVGFDMAHVVARACGGNNDESWNRVPTCGTCNKNVSSETNLLDFVATYYPKRLVAVVRYLYKRFRHRNCFLADRYFATHGLEAFVRTMYGCCGLQTAKDTTLGKFLQRKTGATTDKGRIQNEQVYAILRQYDAHVKAVEQNSLETKQLDKEIEAVKLVFERLLRLRAAAATEKRRLKKTIHAMIDQ